MQVIKPLFGILGFFAVCCGCLKADGAPTATASLQKLQQTFAYQDTTTAETVDISATTSAIATSGSQIDIVQMETFMVTEVIAREDLKKALRDRAAAEAEKRFSWKKGGLLMSKKIGSLSADVGLWPSLETTIAGAQGGGNNDILLRVDVFRLRW